MAPTTEDGAFQAHFQKNKLTLYLTKKGRRVLGVTFHDTFSWCHGITWICTLIPDEYSPYINVKFLQELSALKEQFATHGRLTSIQIDRRMFVFRHETEDKAFEMLGSYTIIEEIILNFLRETGAQVTDIQMDSKVDEAAASIDQETLPRGTTDQDVLYCSKHEDDVDAPHSHPQQRHGDIPHAQEYEDAAHPYVKKDEDTSHPHAQKDEDASHLTTGSDTYTGASGNSKTEKSITAGQINTNAIYQDNRTVKNKIIINLPSWKPVCESCWKAKHENIPQPNVIDIETLQILLKELFPGSLICVWWGCMVFCFEHESMEDAMGMIGKHAVVKEDILHFLQELDPSIDDIMMEVEVRELSEPEEQTAQTSESGQIITGMDGDSTAVHSTVSGTQNAQEMHQDFGNIHIGDVYNFNCEGGTHETSSHIKPAPDKHILQVPMEAFHRLGRWIKTWTRGTADPEHKDEKGASPSHQQQKDDDETSQPYIQETGDKSSSLSHSPQTKDEDTCLQHPKKTEEDKTPLQQKDEDTSHLHPKEVYVKDKFKYQPIRIKKASSDPSLKRLVKGQDSDRRASSDPSQGQSGRRRYPRLSTASHATPSQADYDLYNAIVVGDLVKVERLLSTPGVNVNSREEWSSQTPVMAAAWGGHRDVVELLVSKGADVSLVDRDGYNILHFACLRGHLETVKYVLSLNVVDINARDIYRRTAAVMARLVGHQLVFCGGQ